jgi:hypothetical protein
MDFGNIFMKPIVSLSKQTKEFLDGFFDKNNPKRVKNNFY